MHHAHNLRRQFILRQSLPVMQKLMENIQLRTGVDIDQIKPLCRKRDVAYARHLLCYSLRRKTKLSLQQIADLIDRTHAAVLHSINTISNLMDVHEDVKNEVEFIMRG